MKKPTVNELREKIDGILLLQIVISMVLVTYALVSSDSVVSIAAALSLYAVFKSALVSIRLKNF